WPAASDDMGLEFSQPWDRVVDVSRGPEWATWYVGGKLNLAWNCVHRWAERTPDVAAALWESEDGERHGLSYRELSERVTRFAEALASLGVDPGDRVAFLLPMSPGRDLFDSEAMEGRPGTLEPLQVESEHPYLLTYTSGTTGRPKGVVHVQGGFLVSIAREVAYQADAKPGEVVHFVTDMGWIMGPWEVVGGNALGCTVLFAEGAPDWPAPDRLWSLVERE